MNERARPDVILDNGYGSYLTVGSAADIVDRRPPVKNMVMVEAVGVLLEDRAVVNIARPDGWNHVDPRVRIAEIAFSAERSSRARLN